MTVLLSSENSNQWSLFCISLYKFAENVNQDSLFKASIQQYTENISLQKENLLFTKNK